MLSLSEGQERKVNVCHQADGSATKMAAVSSEDESRGREWLRVGHLPDSKEIMMFRGDVARSTSRAENVSGKAFLVNQMGKS